MNPERLVAGLDIGSSRTTALIAEVVGDLPKHPNIKVMGVGQARTAGLRRGVVSDIVPPCSARCWPARAAPKADRTAVLLAWA